MIVGWMRVPKDVNRFDVPFNSAQNAINDPRCHIINTRGPAVTDLCRSLRE